MAEQPSVPGLNQGDFEVSTGVKIGAAAVAIALIGASRGKINPERAAKLVRFGVKGIAGTGALKLTTTAGHGGPIFEIAPPLFQTETRSVEKTFPLADFASQSGDTQRRILRAIRTDAELRAKVASSPEGQRFLAEQKIQLSAADKLAAAAHSITRATQPVPPKKAAGVAGILAARLTGGAAAAITAIDQFFAANPPDP